MINETNMEYDSTKQPAKKVVKEYNSTGNFMKKVENYNYDSKRNLLGYWDVQAERNTNDMPVNPDTNVHKTSFIYNSAYNYLTEKIFYKDAGTTIKETYTPSSDHKTREWAKVYENSVLKKQTRYLYDQYGNMTQEYQYLDDWSNYIPVNYSL